MQLLRGVLLQVIAMICHCVEVQHSPGPFLIVCPASVISNWAAELSRWAPELKVVQYKGSAEAREDVYYRQVTGCDFGKRVCETFGPKLYSDLSVGSVSPVLQRKWQAQAVD